MWKETYLKWLERRLSKTNSVVFDNCFGFFFLHCRINILWVHYRYIKCTCYRCKTGKKSPSTPFYLFLKLMHTLVHILHFVSRRKLPICCKSLTKFITSVFVEYTSLWTRIELTILVVIDSDTVWRVIFAGC